jgi:hypothetical protein
VSRAAQPGSAADRFAHEIVGFLTPIAARSRRLTAKPLGAGHQHSKQSGSCYDVYNNALANDARTAPMKWSKLKQQIEAQFADSVRTHAAI